MKYITRFFVLVQCLYNCAVFAQENPAEFTVNWANKTAEVVGVSLIEKSEATFIEAEKRARKQALDNAVVRIKELCLSSLSRSIQVKSDEFCVNLNSKIVANTSSRITEYSGSGKISVKFEASLAKIFGDLLSEVEKNAVKM